MAVSELGQGTGMQWKKSGGYSFASSPIAVLQDWFSFRGKREPPTPASLEVVGSMPGADYFYSGQIFTWRGATAAIVKTDGSREHVELLDNDAVSLVPGEGASLVAGSTTLKATLTLNDGQKLEWTRKITVQNDEVESITRESNSFEPVWTAKDNLYTTPIADLPVVNATMKSRREKTGLTTAELLDFTSRIDVFGGKTVIVGIEIAYGDTARHVIASLADKIIESASGGSTISGYRYLSIAGGDRRPVSDWFAIAPPAATAA